MENKKKFNWYRVIMITLGVLLIGIGMSTPGFWPYQLPCCGIGGILIGLS